MLHFARRVPSIPVARAMHLAAVALAREAVQPRPSWTAIFMKAYGIVSQRHGKLRQALIPWPWEHLYEHPYSVCGMPIEREYNDEFVLLATQFRSPESQTLGQLDEGLKRYKLAPVEQIGYFRMTLRMGRMPKLIRRWLWWSTLSLSGFKRAKRLGTFSLSSYGRLGAEQLHPIGPVTTLLTFGPVSSQGHVTVKIVYDHRVLDGAEVARYLAELEQVLNLDIVQELLANREAVKAA
jgi:hypothetical protein